MVDQGGGIDVDDDCIRTWRQRRDTELADEYHEPGSARIGESLERPREHLPHRPRRQPQPLEQHGVVAKPLQMRHALYPDQHTDDEAEQEQMGSIDAPPTTIPNDVAERRNQA